MAITINPSALPTVQLAELTGMHRSRLHGFFARRRGRQEAEDLVQESFARLADAWVKRGAEIENPGAYLSTIASNVLRDRAKIERRRSLAGHISADDVPLAGPDPVAALEARDQLARVEASLARLSPKTRAIFLAHRVEGMSYKDIANRTGLSLKGIQHHMSKAIAHLNGVRKRH